MINIVRSIEKHSTLATIYPIRKPAIATAGVYYFSSGSGIEYEVRFGRKQHSRLAVSIVFGVLNDEYDGEEYVLTNRGEFYSVMATIGRIIQLFLKANPNIHSVEFAGEPAEYESESKGPTKRTLVYLRYAHKYFPSSRWRIEQIGNRVIIEKN